MFGLSISHLLILLVMVLAIFGTKRLFSGLSGGAKDLGTAVKEFKKALRDDDAKPDAKVTDPIQQAVDPAQPPVADVTRVQRPPPVVAPGDDAPPRG